MSGQEKQKKESLSEHEVADYLRAHPNFFQHHGYLLEELIVSHHNSGQAISLIERQVAVLRDQRTELKRKLQHLTQLARTNEQLLERMQHLLLKVLDSTSLEDAIDRITSGLREDFHADEVTLMLFRGPEQLLHFRNPQESSLQPFSDSLSNRKPLCGHLRSEQLATLFGQKADEVASAVMLPLCLNDDECLGLLGIGSIDPKRFHPTMDTAFVSYLGSVLSRILDRYLR
jgi:uncharacterized protein YigA (DUF484 family)